MKTNQVSIRLTGEAIAGGAIKLTDEQAKQLGLLDNTSGEIRGHLKTWGPWQIPVSYRALCGSVEYTPDDKRRYSAQRDSISYYGTRTLSNIRQSGHALEGTVSVNGQKVRGFTSSDLFELSDGRLVSVATIHACI